ncbi:aldehyde dehydrogenase family protein [Cupriavidus basilensis]|nr:aldehyde dehydrogenase family protein [Cupriavidus basilensis]
MAVAKTDEFNNYINGEWSKSASGRTFDNVNPADTGDIVGRFQASSADDAQAAVAAAAAAFDAWKKTPISKRAKILNGAADYLEANVGQIAEELTREEGKALNLSKDEVLRSAQTIRFYAVEGQSFSGETYPQDDPDMIVYSQREPLGVVTVISPWNFPVSIPARKIAPALIAGNTVVFKPSSDAPLSGYRLAQAFVEAGIPKGVLNFITGRAGDVGAAITEAPAVRAISFTGSTAAGQHIHRSVSLSTRTQMELGGKNPLIVMEDADLDRAVDLTIKGGLSLSGQACTGTSRVLVMASVKAAYTREEIFGPVIAIIEVSSYADAITKANDTEYGLSAAIVTSNPRYAHDFAHDIQSGTVKINRTTTGNLINAPFGGLKQSSTSTFRESGRAGLEFYTQIKTVYRGC